MAFLIPKLPKSLKDFVEGYPGGSLLFESKKSEKSEKSRKSRTTYKVSQKIVSY